MNAVVEWLLRSYDVLPSFRTLHNITSYIYLHNILYIMFCQNCGKEMPDGAAFCPHCGIEKGETPAEVSTSAGAGKNKNMLTALIISFILIGLGIAYAGNKKKGIIIFAVGLVFGFLGIGIPICTVISLIIWTYGMYETYNQVKIANGESNPNFLDEFKTGTTSKKIVSLFIVLLVLLVLIGGSIYAFMPKHVDDTYTDYDSDYDTSSLDEDLDDDYSSSSADSYSSSSNGRDVSSHYEGEYGTADTEGTINDDGSVDAHQTGHTDYGDYEINSHMDSDGKVSGTVEVDGKTYHVSS